MIYGLKGSTQSILRKSKQFQSSTKTTRDLRAKNLRGLRSRNNRKTVISKYLSDYR